jgi:hypothetical protein
MIRLRAVWPLLLLCATAQAQDPVALRGRHAELHPHLASSPFGRPLHVDSVVEGNRHKGEIHAVIDQPYAAVSAALARPGHWCEILTIQINVKRCEPGADSLSAFITRKPRDTVDGAHRIDFRFEVAASRPDYLHVGLNADAGPVGTRDYQIRLEATPLDGKRTFLRMSYAYTLGTMARLAMDAYLAGAGRDKRGFSVEGGERGVIERAAMRHYLGIEAYLASLAAPPGKRLDSRLRSWYAAAARYPQLQERVGLDEYVEMKHREAAG